MSRLKNLGRYVSTSISRQLVLTILLVQLVLTTLIVFQRVTDDATILRARLVVQSQAYATLLSESALRLVLGNDSVGIENLLRRVGHRRDISMVIIVTNEGKILGHTDGTRVGQFLADGTSRSLLQSELKDPTTAIALRETTDVVESAAPLVLAGRRLGWVRVSLSTSSTSAWIRHAAWRASIAGAGAVAFGGILVMFVARRITRRLRVLVAVVENYESRGVALPSQAMGIDEIGTLSSALVKFTEEISEHRRRLDQDRAQLEIEVRRRTRELTVMLDNIPGLVFYKDTDNRFVRVNRYMEREYGKPRSALEGVRLEDIHEAPLAAKYRTDDQLVIVGRQPLMNIEEPWDTAKGRRWVLTSKIPIINDEDVVEGVLGVAIDVTERVNALNALRTGEQRFRSLVTATTQIVWTTNAQGEVDSELHAWMAFTGQTFEATKGAGWQEALHVEDRDRAASVWSAAVRGHRTYEVEYRARRYDGICRAFAVRGVPVLDEDGAIREWVGTCTDITEQRSADAALERSNARFRTLFEGSPDPAWIIENGYFVDCNQSAIAALGYQDKSQLLEFHPAALSPERQPDGETSFDKAERMMRVALTEKLKRFEWVHRRADGTDFWTEVTLCPLELDGRDVIYCAWRDISERKLLELEQQKLMTDLKRSNGELEQFAYVASHDLQEPLRMVASYTQLLSERYRSKLDERADKYIDYAVDGAKRMQELIDGLLAYSRVGARVSELRQVSTMKCLRLALSNLQTAIDSSQAVVTHSELPSVAADASQLTQLFQNLIGNALKFRGEEPPMVHVAAEPHAEGTCFSVQDHGIGIEPQYSNRIFLMFQRLHERGKYPGCGIGLAVCQKIVERHGGRLWVESELGKGATFFFTWPHQGVENEFGGQH